MMTVRVSWRGLTIGAALAFALAGPAEADGVAQFDKLLKPMVPPGALTYKSASALGDNGFVLEGVTVTDTSDGGDKKQPIAIKKITVEEFDFAGFEKDPSCFVTNSSSAIASSGWCIGMIAAGVSRSSRPLKYSADTML
jgi:hypothetical protein